MDKGRDDKCGGLQGNSKVRVVNLKVQDGEQKHLKVAMAQLFLTGSAGFCS